MSGAKFPTITGADWQRELPAARKRRKEAKAKLGNFIRSAEAKALRQKSPPPAKPMNLLNDVARCDGLLPKVVKMPNGAKGVLWANDCPCRETCARYQQAFRDNPEEKHAWMTHNHGPADECKDYIKEGA